MTDFYAQLEEQLLVAGRRRGARGPARRALAGRGRVLALACVASAAIGATAVAVIGGSDSSPVGLGTPAAPSGRALPAPSARGDLEGIRVAVLNGTTARGVARATADDLAALGARITSISNVSDPGGALTEIRYKRGASAEARRVAGVLGVRRVTSYTTSPPTMAQVDVIVLVGADRLRRTKPAPGPPVVTVPRAPAAPRPTTAPVTPAATVPRAPAAPPPTTAPVTPAAPAVPAGPSRIVTVPPAPAP